jgi:F-type H+-transporting ATPase subunit gamma
LLLEEAMASEKEIRVKISSIKSTQKITSAMELVAASKMKKAQQLMYSGRDYSSKILQIAGHIAHSTEAKSHPFVVQRPTQKVGYIVISSNRGLCAGLNTNLFKKTLENSIYWKNKNVETKLCLIGKKAASFFKSIGSDNILAVITNLGETPTVAELIGGIRIMIDEYKKNNIDRIFIAYNHFVNSIIQKPTVKQILPLLPDETKDYKYSWDYIYEEDPQKLLGSLIERYLESQIYQALTENNACEQAARMLAMKNATDNAKNIIDELQLVYNKARQATITQEISEIIGGASAV